MPAGRPSKYNDEILEKARDYVDNYRDHGDQVPTLVGLALILGIRTETVYAWEADENKEEFSDILTRIRQAQHQRLVNNGLIGDFNPAITKMMLTKHGYSDKQELDHKSTDGSMKPTTIVLKAPDDNGDT